MQNLSAAFKPTRNLRDRLTFETDEQYAKRMRGLNNSYHSHKHRTVAMDKRDARKARNQQRHKSHQS